MSGAVLLAVVVGGPGGCAVYDGWYLYEPRPLEVTAGVPGETGGEPLRTLITVVGVRRADRGSGLPASVEVRLHLENTRSEPVTFDPGTLALFSADLSRFPDPITVPAERLELAAGETAVVRAYFPFPENRRRLDLSGLNVRWTLDVGGRPVTSSASFTRRRELYYPRHDFHFGIGYHRFNC